MFDTLTQKLQGVFRHVTGRGRLSAENIDQALRDVKMALLEADVNYKVVRAFLTKVKERSLGSEVHRSLNPGQQFLKIVRQELTELMGSEQSRLARAAEPPTVVMMVGLQGSGKTTTAAKLALYWKKQGRRPLLAAADIHRPAAVEQLAILGRQLGVPVVQGVDEDAPSICRRARDKARGEGFDFLVVDTAGRLHLDEAMMAELEEISRVLAPHEILLVADAMTGQDAVRTAEAFDRRMDLTGVILTKLDGDARGGAALSIRYVTGKPIKFVGTGERPEQLEVFHPDRMASRILGMGDVLTLIEKAEAAYDEEQARKLEEKLRRQRFTLDDFLDQLKKIRKMGSLEQLVKLIPGMGGLPETAGARPDERELARIEAIICSMTPEERAACHIIDGSRRRRIARGSGTTVQEINRLLERFLQMQKMLGTLARGGLPMTAAAGGRGVGLPMPAGRVRKKPKKKRRIRR